MAFKKPKIIFKTACYEAWTVVCWKNQAVLLLLLFILLTFFIINEALSSDIKAASVSRININTSESALNLMVSMDGISRELESVDEFEINSKATAKEKIPGSEDEPKRIQLIGAVELEAVYKKIKPENSEDENSLDLGIATVEFGAEYMIADYLRSRVLVSYEESDGVAVDEAVLHFQASDVFEPETPSLVPFYGSIGIFTVPFGNFRSHFISDSLTLIVGETKEIAAIAGLYRGGANVAFGAFNGDMDKTNDDDLINGYVAAAKYAPLRDLLTDIEIALGASYTTNMADSDELSDFLKNQYDMHSIVNYVPGFSAIFEASIFDHFYVKAEYVGATESFKGIENFAPKAWDVEFAIFPVDVIAVAFRYDGSLDSLNFLPETQLGIVNSYKIFSNSFIGFECLYEEAQNNNKSIQFTAQFAMEF